MAAVLGLANKVIEDLVRTWSMTKRDVSPLDELVVPNLHVADVASRRDSNKPGSSF